MDNDMLHAILCMTPDMWDNTELSNYQRFSRYVEASDIIKGYEAELQRLRTEAFLHRNKLLD